VNLLLTDMLACPTCGGPLTHIADGLRCLTDEALYPLHPSGIPDLRPAGTRDLAEAFAGQYRAARLAEGWRPLTPDLAQALPHADPPGFPRLYWPLRRESWIRLAQLLTGLGRAPLPIADAGAGFPWLSHRLADLGHTVIAFDLSADADFGLGAARCFPTAVHAAGVMAHTPPAVLQAGQFLPVLGDLAQPPLATGAFAAVICNASLHYTADLAAAVARLARALRPGGALFVVDSPIAAAGRTGDRPGSRVLGRDEVDAALHSAGLASTWHTVRRGRLWWQHRIKIRLLRRPGFEFPIVVGRA